MTNPNTQETATTETTTEKPNTARVQDTQEFKDALSRATSTYQKQASDARKEVRTATQQIAQLSTRITETQREVELARLTGDDDEANDAATRLLDFRQELNSRQSTLEEREGRVNEIERFSTIRLLSEEYGIPQADLEDFDTAPEMETAALKYKLASLGSPNGGGGTLPTEVEKVSKPIDSSEGLSSKGAMPDPLTHPKEFEAYKSRVLTDARRAR